MVEERRSTRSAVFIVPITNTFFGTEKRRSPGPDFANYRSAPVLESHEQLAEHAREVGPIDLVDQRARRARHRPRQPFDRIVDRPGLMS